MTRPPPPSPPPLPPPPTPPTSPPPPSINYNVLVLDVNPSNTSVALTFGAPEVDSSVVYQGVCIFMTGTCNTITTGDVRSLLASSSATLIVSGLLSSSKYTCFVQTIKGSDVVACSIGATISTTYSSG